MQRLSSWMVLGLVMLAVSSTQVQAASEQVTTTITLKVLDCEGCAKKVAQTLSQISGVANVKMDVKSKTATVAPKNGSTLSPRALWEAVQRAGKQPVKLVGPNGNFISKPKS